jgi:hypothetical protein
MINKTLFLAFIVLTVFSFAHVKSTWSFVMEKEGKTYIVDRKGEHWDVSQAKSIGFDPKRFQYGIGRDAFTPLDDSYLTRDTESVANDLRVIGVEQADESQAYSVPRLSWHEIANSEIGSTPIAVGY